MKFPKSKIKVALCLPWYAGADRDCIVHFLEFQHYLGRLQERLHMNKQAPWVAPQSRLDPVNATGFSEIPRELLDAGVEFEFGLVDEIGCSLPGLARERCVENAIKWGADFLLFYDSDMIFGTDLFLRLFMAQKPVVAALAFTSREPITPVIYRFVNYEHTEARLKADIEPIYNYKHDALQQVDAVGGGVMLIDANVFKAVPQPWFNSPGLGEDIFFCLICKHAGVEVWVDTRAKTIHKPTFHKRWHDEGKYHADFPYFSPKKEKVENYEPAPDEDLAHEISDMGDHVVRFSGPVSEGSCTLSELQFLTEESRTAQSICEVGFNIGFSAVALLRGNPTSKVVSFDEGKWPGVKHAGEYLQNRYPDRHELILGDSKQTLNGGLKHGPFDLSFIDGGHDFPTAWSDIKHLAPISRRLVIDDPWMPGVRAAVDRAIEEGLIKNPKYFSDPQSAIPTDGDKDRTPYRYWLTADGGRA